MIPAKGMMQVIPDTTEADERTIPTQPSDHRGAGESNGAGKCNGTAREAVNVSAFRQVGWS